MKRCWIPLLVLAIGWLGASVVEACPMCKAALESSDRSQGDYVSGFFYSILFMLSMPFAILGCFSTYMYALVRRARAAQAAAGAQPSADSPIAPHDASGA